MLKKLKQNKKGFTLVEIIVVLVILAILAAAAIPTMLGFVDDANGKTEVANARAAYVAAQTIATENHATGGSKEINAAAVSAMAGIDPEPTSVSATVNSNGKVTEVVYKNNGFTVTIHVGGTTDVVKDA